MTVILMSALPTEVHNILSVYNCADYADVIAGREWYQTAQDLAREIAPNLAMGAGVIAALSPQMSWDRNVLLARRAFHDGAASGGLGANVRKADRILAGESPDDVLGGLKVRSFYANIVEPHGEAVTVDRHAYDIALGRVTPSAEKFALARKGVYAGLADHYRLAAQIAHVPPATMQAITWCAWRRAKGLA